jgi:DNA-binding NarL/FixJ family response regulator
MSARSRDATTLGEEPRGSFSMDRYDISDIAPNLRDEEGSRGRSMIEHGAAAGVVLFAVRSTDADGVLARVRHMLPEGSVLYARREAAGARDLSLTHGLSTLTARQHDILRLLMHDLSNKEIGRRLKLSHFTVRNHVSQLLRQLNVPSRKAVVALLNDSHSVDAHVLPLSD